MANIATASDLNNIRNGLSGDYVLTADIDLSGYANWEPIGSAATPFTGKLDGNGFTISNLAIDRGSTDNVGLFGVCSFTVAEARIIDVVITGADITGQDNVGALSGKLITNKSQEGGFDMVVDCLSTGIVDGRNNVGGLIGHIEGPLYAGHITAPNIFSYAVLEEYLARLTSCASSAAVTGAGVSIGGLVGQLREIMPIECRATGDVSGGDVVGGLIGFFFRGAITNSYAEGAVTGNKTVGGLIGHASYRPIIRKSYATGAVEATETISEPDASSAPTIGAGGLVGYMDIESLDRCYASGAVTGKYRVGGLVGSAVGGGFTSGNFRRVFAIGAVSAIGGAGGLIGFMFPRIGWAARIEQAFCSGPVTADKNSDAVIGQKGATFFEDDPAVEVIFTDPAFYDYDLIAGTAVNGGEGISTADFAIETTFDTVWDNFDRYWVIDTDESDYPLLKVFYDPTSISLSAKKGHDGQGLVLAYASSGKTYYRSFNGSEWSAEEQITEIPEPALNPNLFRTIDNRLAIAVSVDSALFIAVTEESSLTIDGVYGVGSGLYGNGLHLSNDRIKLYFITPTGTLAERVAELTSWNEINFDPATPLPSDSGMSKLKAIMVGEKSYIVWRSRGQHRLSFQDEGNTTTETIELSDGTITIRQDTPVVEVSFSLEGFDRGGDDG